MTEPNLTFFYLGVGFVVMANIGTILSVWVISIKIAMAFKSMQKDVEKNSYDIQNNWNFDRESRREIDKLKEKLSES